jgi:hypothetical protein
VGVPSPFDPRTQAPESPKDEAQEKSLKLFKTPVGYPTTIGILSGYDCNYIGIF